MIYRDDAPEFLLVQPADSQERANLSEEAARIREISSRPFALVTYDVTDWNRQLSPWEAPPVFGNEGFGGGAEETLCEIREALIPGAIRELGLSRKIPVIVGGYSLAGLFALWAVYGGTDFRAAAAASPSVWFPGWIDFAGTHLPSAGTVYLSLGKKEERVRNRTMAQVGACIRRQYALLEQSGIRCTLAWNEGNHFTQPERRTAAAFAWCMEHC
ncbi:MAG: esterase [Oscillospiraceae bacterium]|nr:esterase [Oscillospiraceae bacterium]